MTDYHFFINKSIFIVKSGVLIALFHSFLSYTWDNSPLTFHYCPRLCLGAIMMSRVNNPRYMIGNCGIKLYYHITLRVSNVNSVVIISDIDTFNYVVLVLFVQTGWADELHRPLTCLLLLGLVDTPEIDRRRTGPHRDYQIDILPTTIWTTLMLISLLHCICDLLCNQKHYCIPAFRFCF